MLPPPSLHKWDISFPYSKRVEGLHKEFAAAAGMPPYSCVLVRRGERLPLYSGLDALTRGDHIRRVLGRSADAPRFVYIITDEQDRAVFDLPSRPRLAFWHRAFWRQGFWRKDPFHFVFADDYEFLRRLKAEDNYLLFCVQLLIMEHAAYRVSTFKKPYAAHPHAPFHDHLAEGWEANI